MTKPFGWELLLDCYKCSSEVIDDVNHVYNFLEEAILVLGVTKQAPPYVFHSPKEFPDKAGISAWVPLVESGIQTHTLTEKNYVSIDYFTCGVIDEEMKDNLIKLAKKYFLPKRIEHLLIPRGIDYYEQQQYEIEKWREL